MREPKEDVGAFRLFVTRIAVALMRLGNVRLSSESFHDTVSAVTFVSDARSTTLIPFLSEARRHKI